MITSYRKGYSYTALSIVAASTMYLLTKLSINTSNVYSLMGIYFFSASILGSTTLKIFSRIRLANELKQHFILIIIVSALTIIGAYFWFLSIDRVGAAATSLLAKFQIVFTVIAGVIFLKEQFGKSAWIALLIIMTGSIMVIYKGGTFDLTAVMWMIIFAFCYAMQSYMIRKFSPSIDMMAITVWRSFFIGIFFIAVALIKSKLEIPPTIGLAIMVVAGTMGAFLSKGFQYLAFSYLPISKVSTAMNGESLLTVTLAAIFLGERLSMINLLGGLFIIAGTILLIHAETDFKTSKA